jgi:choline dehydrogenase-like flavoprotein
MDLRSPNRFGAAFVEAGQQAGLPLNPDFNGEQQEGVGMYQVTHRTASAQRRQGLPDAAPGPAQPEGDHRRARPRASCSKAGARSASRCASDGASCSAAGAARGAAGAGALQSPQMLMLSGIGAGAQLQQHGIGVVHDLPGVGAHLHDHPDVVQVLRRAAPEGPVRHLLRPAPGAVKGILEWRRQRSGMLTTNFAEAGAFIKSQPGEPPHPTCSCTSSSASWSTTAARPCSAMATPATSACCARSQPRQPQAGQRRPRGGPADRPQLPRRTCRRRRLIRGFKVDAEDPAAAGAGGDSAAKELCQLCGGADDAQIEQLIRAMPTPIYHPVGSCRMGSGADGRGRRTNCACTACRGCAWWTRRSCRASWSGQHQCAGDHDRREGGRHDQGRRRDKTGCRQGGRRSGILTP